MDAHPFRAYSHIGGRTVGPPAGVVILNPVFLARHRYVSMPTENPIGMSRTGMDERSQSHFGGQSQPAGIKAVHKTRELLALEVHLLHLQVNRRHDIRKQVVVQHKAIELMTVNRKMPSPIERPRIFLVHAYPDQMGHDVRQSRIVVSFHPNHFDISLGIRQLADAPEELPVLFVETAEIEVGKDIAQKNEPPKAVLLQHVAGIPSAAQLGPEMQIGEDESVVNLTTHHLRL